MATLEVTVHRGDVLRLTGTFTDIDGTAVDPTAVYFQSLNPRGAETELQYGVDAALKKSTTGVYYVDLNVNMGGTWKVRMYSTGNNQAAMHADFKVPHDDFT